MKYLLWKSTTENIEQWQEHIWIYPIEAVEVLSSSTFEEVEKNWNCDEFQLDWDKDIGYLKIYGEEPILEELLEVLEGSVLLEQKDENWNKKWIEEYEPVEVAGFRVIAPHHRSLDTEKEIIINPAMAFGTGYHETTSTCMEALRSIAPLEGLVYDVGCGSAILSIAAVKLGAQRVIAIDIDEDALSNAEENVMRNHMEDKITLVNSSLLRDMEEEGRVIVANILPHILKDMVEDAKRLLHPQGTLILSGILDERIEEVKKEYEYFTFIEKFSKNKWNTFCISKVGLMHRFFAQEKKDGILYIKDGKELHHMKNALRVAIGEDVEVLYENRLYRGKVVRYSDKGEIEITEEITVSQKGELVLLQGTPKGSKLDQILRQGTEVGATGFYIVDMERSIAVFSEKKLERYQGILESATKQSKSHKVPSLQYYKNLESVDFSSFHQVIICDEQENQKTSFSVGEKVLLVIGPEGGISEKERDYLQSLPNSVSFSLGKRILRTETAGLKALSIIEYLQENQ